VFKNKIKIEKDLLYIFLLIFITEVFFYNVDTTPFPVLAIIGGFGLLLLETWFIQVFSKYSGRKVSKYSDVIVKISLKDRFFSYFILPGIFYISLLAFLYFTKNALLGHFASGVSMVLILILFLNVQASLNRVYTVTGTTKAIFDFICITIFYLLINIFIRLGLSLPVFIALGFISAFVLLFFILKLHDRVGLIEFIITFLSSIFIASSLYAFWNFNVFVIPAVGALAFYLIVSLWNIRFSGKIYLIDYFVPFLYVGIALILILNL
jgi:hypothetical protein